MKRGFTLIELLVVISIISLLASIVNNALSSAREEARRAAFLQQGTQIIRAIEMYYGANGEYPLSDGDIYKEGAVFRRNSQNLGNCTGARDVGGVVSQLDTVLAPYLAELQTDFCYAYQNGRAIIDADPPVIEVDTNLEYYLYSVENGDGLKMLASDIPNSQSPCVSTPPANQLYSSGIIYFDRSDASSGEAYCWNKAR